MAYVKQNFYDGQTLKAEHLNKIEQGIVDAEAKAPKRGTDYWTESDKTEIKSYVDESILGGKW